MQTSINYNNHRNKKILRPVDYLIPDRWLSISEKVFPYMVVLMADIRSWGNPSWILLFSSNLFSWSLVKSKSRQPKLSLIWASVLAPIMGIITALSFCCRLIQFKATCEGVLVISFAIACTSVTIEILLSFSDSNGLLTFCSLYFPERTPLPNGDHTVTPISKARLIGSNSLSTDLSIKLYIT